MNVKEDFEKYVQKYNQQDLFSRTISAKLKYGKLQKEFNQQKAVIEIANARIEFLTGQKTKKTLCEKNDLNVLSAEENLERATSTHKKELQRLKDLLDEKDEAFIKDLYLKLEKDLTKTPSVGRFRFKKVINFMNKIKPNLRRQTTVYPTITCDI